jgi:DNA-binding XRE family transcriptional regulator
VGKQRFRHPVDAQVGNSIRVKRSELGLSQAYMANQIGVTIDQYRECESGADRFGAECILKIARLLGVRPQDLFEVLPDAVSRKFFN